MSELKPLLEVIDNRDNRPKLAIVQDIETAIQTSGYRIVDKDDTRPWGGFFRFSTADADAFLKEFFPEIDPDEARLGNPTTELSPKILIVSPEQRLSWQYHYRRAEVWRFLTSGAYERSLDDQESAPIPAHIGDKVVFDKAERHRLIGATGMYTLVAEIWQHTNPEHLSDEADIVRVQDDYKRA